MNESKGKLLQFKRPEIRAERELVPDPSALEDVYREVVAADHTEWDDLDDVEGFVVEDEIRDEGA